MNEGGAPRKSKDSLRKWDVHQGGCASTMCPLYTKSFHKSAPNVMFPVFHCVCVCVSHIRFLHMYVVALDANCSQRAPLDSTQLDTCRHSPIKNWYFRTLLFLLARIRTIKSRCAAQGKISTPSFLPEKHGAEWLRPNWQPISGLCSNACKLSHASIPQQSFVG